MKCQPICRENISKCCLLKILPSTLSTEWIIDISYLKGALLSYYSKQDNIKWLNDINRTETRRGSGHNKLRTYRRFKFKYKSENYIKIGLSRGHRNTNAKFRIGIAPLRLETGRYEQIELDTFIF